jgi:hypothetical protein
MVEPIILVIAGELQERIVPLIKEKYKDKELIIVKSPEELEPGTQYIQLMTEEDYNNTRVFQVPKIPEIAEIPVLSAYEDNIRNERKYLKEQQKYARNYVNKHYKK